MKILAKDFEINKLVDEPWRHATCTMYQLINIDANRDYRTGIPWSILNSGEFKLVIWNSNPKTKYPEPQSAEEGLYIVGSTGTIRGTGSDRIKWEIRYDWDPARRYHVNLHVTTNRATMYSMIVNHEMHESHSKYSSGGQEVLRSRPDATNQRPGPRMC